MVQKDESSAGANGSLGATEAGEVEGVSKFEDTRWIGGTWDLKKFEKDGKPDWDAVIDAGEVLGLCQFGFEVTFFPLYFMLYNFVYFESDFITSALLPR